MNRLLNRLAIASLLSLLSALAPAQSAVYAVQHCQVVGPTPREDAGDPAGHSITVVHYSCRQENGLMQGAVSTGLSIIDWTGSTGVGVASNTVSRKPGALTVTTNQDLKATAAMTESRSTGAVSAGRGHFAVALGSAAPLAGKAYHWSSRPTGPGQFDIEITLD